MNELKTVVVLQGEGRRAVFMVIYTSANIAETLCLLLQYRSSLCHP